MPSAPPDSNKGNMLPPPVTDILFLRHVSSPRIVFLKDGLLTAERVPLPMLFERSPKVGVKMEEVDPPSQ